MSRHAQLSVERASHNQTYAIMKKAFKDVEYALGVDRARLRQIAVKLALARDALEAVDAEILLTGLLKEMVDEVLHDLNFELGDWPTDTSDG